MIAALLIGLLAGFAGGFVVGQRGEPIPTPRTAAAAQAAAPAPVTVPQPETYTEASIPDASQERPTQSLQPEPAEADSVARRPLPLERAGPGSLQIASRPTGAQVFVDDVRVGVTPLSMPSIVAGQHRVRIELPGFRPWTTSVDVASGPPVRVGASLER